MFFIFFSRIYCHETVNVHGVIYTKVDSSHFSVWNPSNKNAITEKNENVKIEKTLEFEGKKFTVTSIGDYAFSECSHLFSISLPDTIKTIGKFAFFNCITLDSILVPNSVNTISEYSFAGCSSLNSIQLGAGLHEIGNNAFDNCLNLKCAIIPTNVAHIGKDAFKSCSELALLAYDGKYRMDEDVFGSTLDENKLQIYVTCDYHSDFFGKVKIHNPCTGNNKKILLINRVMAIFIGFFTIGVLVLFKYLSY